MKSKCRWLALVSALLLALPMAASADCELAAQMTDGNVAVAWKSDRDIGNGTLTLYRDNWPVLVLCARGTRGTAGIPGAYVSGSGSYKLTLRGNCGCVTVSVPAGTTVPAETAKPAPETQAPAATPQPTAQPTAAPLPTASPTAAPTQSAGSQSASLAQDMVAEVNRDRIANGLGTLSVDANLTSAACVRAKEIVEKFSHTRPDGTSWTTVYSGAYGENIARGYDTAYKCEAAFMSSEGHRANILRSTYTKIGVCAYTVGGVTYWVQLFGR